MAVERPAAVRPFWSGVVTFGLVSIPVDLFAATRSSRVSLRMLGPEGRPLRRRYVQAEQERPLSSEEIVRGYEVEPDVWVTVTDKELEDLEPAKTREIDLRRFVDRAAIDPMFCDRPYFLLPQGEVDKAYRLLARTMEETGRAGIASFVMRGREHLVAILADGGILRAETLRHADEVRTAEIVGLPEPVAAPSERVARLQAAIESAAADDLDVDELSDERAAALRALGRRKGEDQLVHVPEAAPEEEEEEGEVVDIMALLRQRLGMASPRDALEGLSKKELYERAQERDLPGRSKMSREELIEALVRDRQAGGALA